MAMLDIRAFYSKWVSYYVDPSNYHPPVPRDGEWVSAGGWGITEGSPVTKADLKNALSFIDPVTGEKYGKDYGVKEGRRKVWAYDFKLTLPKSVSAYWAVADPVERRLIERAVDHGNHALVTELQSRVMPRKGTGSKLVAEVPRGAAIATFYRVTSRAGNPQIYRHNLVINKVQCDDGIWRAIYGRPLYWGSKTISMLYSATARTSLTQSLGVSWTPRNSKDSSDICGVPSQLMALWSNRSKQTQSRKESGETKDWNIPPVGLSEHHLRWAYEAQSAGFDPGGVCEAVRTSERPEPDPLENHPEVFLDEPITQQFLNDLAVRVGRIEKLTEERLNAEVAATIAASRSVYLDDGLRNADPYQLVKSKYDEVRKQLVDRLGTNIGRGGH